MVQPPSGDKPESTPNPIEKMRLEALLSGIRSEMEREEAVLVSLQQTGEVIVSLLPLLPSPEPGSVPTDQQRNAQTRIRSAFEIAESLGQSFFHKDAVSDAAHASTVGLGRAQALQELVDQKLITMQECFNFVGRNYTTTNTLGSLLSELDIIRREHWGQIYG